MSFTKGRHGWSESFYDDRFEGTGEAVRDAMKAGGLLRCRAALLPINAELTGVRVNVVGERRKSYRAFSPGDFRGEGTYKAGVIRTPEDIGEEPFTAALLDVNCADDAVRSYLMRGLPDGVVGPAGTLIREPEWFRRLHRYYQVLSTGQAQGGVMGTGYSMRSTLASTDTRVIEQFTAVDGRTATFTTTQAFNDPGANWARAFLIRVKPPLPGWIGTFRGEFVSNARLAVNLYATRQLGSGPNDFGGTIAPLIYSYKKIQILTIQEIRQRKTGRPSGGPRGRSSKGRYLR